jgi:predicted anti-sigma-YlaC factor YlaD
MKACPDHQETLWLDVYGELHQSDRPAWESHLDKCNGCRLERERIHRLLQQVKEALPSPALTPDKAEALSATITRGLKGESVKSWWQKSPLRVSTRLVPALAAASLLIVAFGWVTLKGIKGPSTAPPIPLLKAEEQMIVKDLDIFSNLELLEEMDHLQKLLQVVDHRDVM